MNRLNDETAVIPAVPRSEAEAHEGLSAELAAAAPKRWWNKGTVVLGVGLLLMGGFLGGVQAQKQWGTSSASAAGPGGSGGGRSGGFPSGMSASGAPGGGGFGQQQAASSDTAGKVKLVNGTTIYVETEDGSVVTVKTGAGTTVSTAEKGKLSDVKAGDSVTVEGDTADDGSVTATTVTKK
ncbi:MULTISPECIES: hypothetical protein [Actinoplanes]|uniref:hypothetical protein n=1 Tax=Actinoplanes TaxID=1865 RepID=UPI000695F1E0|nr:MULTISPECIES: hypothetical protein [Actinoplanes]GLY06317.1 hypothetical protein Acsp01_66960 [Actinoplanes sp. NBRC 101535]